MSSCHCGGRCHDCLYGSCMTLVKRIDLLDVRRAVLRRSLRIDSMGAMIEGLKSLLDGTPAEAIPDSDADRAELRRLDAERAGLVETCQQQGCDLIRAVVTGVMIWPGLPLSALITLLCLVTVFQPPFDAARSAVTRDILNGPRYVFGLAVIKARTVSEIGGMRLLGRIVGC